MKHGCQRRQRGEHLLAPLLLLAEGAHEVQSQRGALHVPTLHQLHQGLGRARLQHGGQKLGTGAQLLEQAHDGDAHLQHGGLFRLCVANSFGLEQDSWIRYMMGLLICSVVGH